ncbi:MAG: hypothetical protein VZQ83_07590 [Eubacterium sp.]|nr:hypothetical protein [Eubacterium sp.]
MKGKRNRKVLKTALAFVMAVALVFGITPMPHITEVAKAEGNAAKVGETEYATFDAAVSAWLGASDGATLTLLADVVTTGPLNIPEGKYVTLDLNNHGILNTGSTDISGNRVIRIGNGSSLTLTDTATDKTTRYITLSADGRGTAVSNAAPGSGTQGVNYLAVTGGYISGGYCIYGQGGTGTNGGGVFIGDDGTFNMSAGTICGNCAEEGAGVYAGNGTFSMSGTAKISNNRSFGNESRGGGVYLIDGTFNMSGNVEISGNTALGDYGGVDGFGGGVYLVGSHGTFNMSGGKIVNNSARRGGGVCVDYGTFNLTGGEVTGNNSTQEFGGGVCIYGGDPVFELSGEAKITGNTTGTGASAVKDNVWLQIEKTITVTGSLGATASIGVTLVKWDDEKNAYVPIDGVFAMGPDIDPLTPSDAAKFTSDSDTYSVKLDDSYNTLTFVTKPSGGSGSGGSGSGGSGSGGSGSGGSGGSGTPTTSPSPSAKPSASPAPSTNPTADPSTKPAPTIVEQTTDTKTNEDGTTTTTITTLDSEGTKTVEAETVKGDGSIEKVTDIAKSDGSTEKVVETQKPDGTFEKVTDIANADGSTEKSTETVNPDGSFKKKTEIVEKDGSTQTIIESVKPSGASEKTVDIEKADGTVIYEDVKTTAKGKETSYRSETALNGDKTVTEQVKQPSGDVTKTTTSTTVKKDADGNIIDTSTKIAVEVKTGATTTKTSFSVISTEPVAKKNALNPGIKMASKKKNQVALTKATTTAKSKTVTIPESVKADGKTYTVTTLKKGLLKGNKTKPKKVTIQASGITKVEKDAFNKLAKNATIRVKAGKKDFKRIKKQITKSGLPKGVKVKRV